MVRSQRSSSPSKEWPPKASAAKRSPRRFGLPLLTTKRRFAEAALGGRGGCRTTLGDHEARRLVCLSFSSVLGHISRTLRDLCVCSVGPMITIRRVMLPRCLLRASFQTHHAAQSPARPQQRPGVHQGGALARETVEMWETMMIASFTFTFRPPW